MRDLVGLAELTSLRINGAEIADLSPLARLPRLTKLTLENAKVADLSQLAAIDSLTWLVLEGYTLENLDFLAGFTHLERLSLNGCTVQDLSFEPLTGLGLTGLDIPGMGLATLDELPALPELTHLNVSGNALTEIGYLSRFPHLSSLDASRNNISDIVSLITAPYLEVVSLSDNQIAHLDALGQLPFLSRLSIQGNPVFNFEPLETSEMLEYLDTHLTMKIERVAEDAIEVTAYETIPGVLQDSEVKISFDALSQSGSGNALKGSIIAPLGETVTFTLSPGYEYELTAATTAADIKAASARLYKLPGTAFTAREPDPALSAQPAITSAMQPHAYGENLGAVHSVAVGESVFPDFGAMAGLAPLTDQTMAASGLRTLTYQIKSSTAVSSFVKTAEADGFIATRTKENGVEIIQFSHPLLTHGFSMIYTSNLKLVSMMYPAEAALGDAEAMAAFWYAKKPYSFFDRAFELRARSALKLMTGTITPEMLASVTSLSLVNADVADFRDLAMFTGLKKLTLDGVTMDDISDLAAMQGLEELYLRNIPISSLKPLAGLDLKHLEIADTKVRDLKPLAKMANLETLSVERSRVETLPDMSGMISLKALYLSGNDIAELAPLAKLPMLEKLALNDNAIRSIKALANLTHLEWLELNGNAIRDYSPVWAIQNGTQKHFLPEYIIDTSTKGTALTVNVLPGCHDPEKAAQVAAYINLKDSPWSDSEVMPDSGLKLVSIGESISYELMPYLDYSLVTRIRGGESYRFDDITAPKASAFRDHGFSVKKTQMIWLAANADTGDYFDSFAAGTLKDLTASKITHEQLQAMIEGKQKLTLYLSFSMSAPKEDAQNALYCIMKAPDGKQTAFQRSHMTWEAGNAFGLLSFPHLSDGMVEFFKATTPKDGKYTLYFLFDDKLVSTETFTIVP
ncbi:MAG: hypothetical protein LBM74_00385 [Oscillospiraceae bacterium]|jgi:Leucine-rich repeat (LRR) protein|nr:hypothetical protein [Oscillospiraceae bacterium]